MLCHKYINSVAIELSKRLLIPRRAALCPQAMLGEPLFLGPYVPVWMLPSFVLCLALSRVISCVRDPLGSLAVSMLFAGSIERSRIWISKAPEYQFWLCPDFLCDLKPNRDTGLPFCFPLWQMRNTLVLCQMSQHLNTKKL